MISRRRLFGTSWLDVLDNARDELVAQFHTTNEVDADFGRTDKLAGQYSRTAKEDAEFTT